MAHLTRQTALTLLGLTTCLAGSTPAEAATSHSDVRTLLLRNGNDAGRTRVGDDGRERALDQRGTGAEHVQMAQLASGEIMMFGIGSYRLNGELPPNRLQMFCASVSMDPMTGPSLQTMKYVTNLDGNRYRNGMHPRVLPIFGGEALAVTYNYAPDNRARAYMQVFGPGCQPMSEMTQIMRKNNDDCSENKGPGVVVEQTESYARILEMHGCNGNGSDDAWITGTMVSKTGPGTYEVQKEYDFVVERNEERTRGTVLLTDTPGFALACFTAGNTQPPNKGVRCAGINTAQNVATEERLLWRQYIAEREDRTYRTEVRVASVLDAAGKPTNKAYLVYQESVRNRNRGKGSQQLLATVVEATPQGLNMLGVPQTGVFPASDATHGTACSTSWGTVGQETSRAFLISASHNGSPGALAAAQLVDWDGTTRSMKPDRKLSLNAAIDHQWLSNIYGNNPNTQGRNFITCVGNIKNPGFGVQGGYMSDVKYFVGVPATTRRMDEATGRPEEKLATELVLVPAVIAAAQAEPQPLPPPNPTSPGVPPTPNGSGTVPPVNNEGPTTGTPTGPENTPSASEQPAGDSEAQPSGGDVLTTDGDTNSTGTTPPGATLGCTQAAGSGSSSPFAFLALLGLVGFIANRRRH